MQTITKANWFICVGEERSFKHIDYYLINY